MILFRCPDSWKQYAVILLGLVSLNTTAIQPISEDHLAVTTGDQSPINIISSPDKESDRLEIINEQDLNLLQKQITSQQQQQYSAPLQVSIAMNTQTLQNKQEALVVQTQSNLGNLLSLEGVSMMWDNGKLITIADLEKMGDLGLNNETGSYELKNVKGTVTIVTTIH